MSVVPYGYRVNNGLIEVDDTKAHQIMELFNAYLAGCSYSGAGKAAGLNLTHSSIKNILRNKRYLGDNMYPRIIDKDIFARVSDRMNKRCLEVRAERSIPVIRTYKPDTTFRMRKADRHVQDPLEHAEYLYSLIERRTDGKNC